LMNSTPAFFNTTVIAALTAAETLVPTSASAHFTVGTERQERPANAGSAQLSWAGHYMQALPPSDDPKVSQSHAVPTDFLDVVRVPF